jgi:hypothetical protein
MLLGSAIPMGKLGFLPVTAANLHRIVQGSFLGFVQGPTNDRLRGDSASLMIDHKKGNGILHT